jgi:ribose 5-phosphate isomerase B
MIAVASDHGGFELKTRIIALLKERGIDFSDYGPLDANSVDYPDFAAKVAGDVSCGKVAQGVLICGTGIGMSIAANKFPNVRAALVHDEFTAQMAREHNNANILVLGGRILDPEQGAKLVELWLNGSFEGGRHQNRLDKIIQIEQTLAE